MIVSNKDVIKDIIGSSPVGTDVHIDVLFGAIETDQLASSPRTKQQIVGAYICRINNEFKRANKRLKIEPGTARRTYRLVRV